MAFPMLTALRWRRAKRAAFWLLGSDRLVLCRLRREQDEPFLEACYGWQGHPGSKDLVFAPGLLELAELGQVFSLPCVAALSADLARLVEPGDVPSEAKDLVFAEASGGNGAMVAAERRVVERAFSLFERAGLDLCELDAEVCAVDALRRFLGKGAAGDPTPDVLAAVSVEATRESEALELGELLAAPVGLAIARWAEVGDDLAR